jgi:hypothetical protein
MTEIEALEKSIVLWTALIDRLSDMASEDLEQLEEDDLNELKRRLDPDIYNYACNCYMCEFFYDSKLGQVDCSYCCISNDCGTCNCAYKNAFEELTSAGNPRINKLRAANRILRSMKDRYNMYREGTRRLTCRY